MCLGIPGCIDETYTENGLPMGRVDFGGIKKAVCLAYVPEATVGNYVIVHVGFAITLLDEESAKETLALFEDMGLLAEELGVDTDGGASS